MWIGFDEEEWGRLVISVLHEAKEFVQMRMGLRFIPGVDYANDAAGYVFMETHAQHAEVCARVGWFLATCMPDVCKAWRAWKKGKC
jgi:hypothetical protein